MTPSFVPFHDLKSGAHALTDASSLIELRAHSGTLTTKLNPSMARTILNDLDGFSLKPSLSLLERWIVVDLARISHRVLMPPACPVEAHACS